MTGRSEFPAVGSFRRCMSNNTPNSALHRLGYSKEKGVGGFRAAANPDAIERQLADMEENKVRRAYAAPLRNHRYQYDLNL